MCQKMIKRNNLLVLAAICYNLFTSINCSTDSKKLNSIKVELIGDKIYAERPIHINKKSVIHDIMVKDSIYIPPSIIEVEDVAFDAYFECFNSIFTNLDTIKSDYRGVKIIFLYDDKTFVKKSFYGKDNIDFIINKLETSAVSKYDSIGANVINTIKKNKNFYYH